MRLNFSGVSEDDIREGVRRIGKVVARAGRALRDADRRRAGEGAGARGAAGRARGRAPNVLPLRAARRSEPRRVLKGGRSLERQVSLRSGAQVQDALERLGHDVSAIDVGPDLVDRLEEARADVAFVALHGRGGEDGTVQELLELVGLPYTGSGPAACIRCMDKVLSKHAMRDAGIPTPDFYSFSETAFSELGAAKALPAIEARLEFPIVVKPAGQGSALGIKFAAHRRPTCRARSWPPSPTTPRAARALRRRPRPRGLRDRRPGRPRRSRSSRRSRSRRTSTTSRRATRSAAPISGARRSWATT